MSMKKRFSLFVCLLNLVPMLNADVRIKAMGPEVALNLCANGGSSDYLEQHDKIKPEDKKEMMKRFKQNENWELKKEIDQIENGEYKYQTADSIDIFTCDGGKTNYVLKILPLDEEKSFESENLAHEKLANKKLELCPKLAKNFGVFPPIHVGPYKNAETGTEVYYAIYEYAGENKRNSENLSDKQKVEIWNNIVRKKCRALSFLLSKGIMHCDPGHNNWIIQWEDCKDNDVKVSLIDFGLTNEIDINKLEGVPIREFIDPYCYKHKEVLTNRELNHLLDSLSYDLCDLLSIPHDKKDSADYGRFVGVKKNLNNFINTESEITLGNYKKLIGEMGNIIKDLSVNRIFI